MTDLELIKELQDALCNVLPYVTDVLDDPVQLKAFKKGAVEKDVKNIRDAIEKATSHIFRHAAENATK